MRPGWRPRAVLFDFDGTLADSYDAIAASVNHVRAGYGLPPLPVSEVRRHVGRGPQFLLEQTVPVGDWPTNLAQYRSHHPGVMRSGTRLLPGAATVLQRLREAGCRLGVCSNKPAAFTADLVRYLGIDRWLDLVLGPEDVAHPKPAPDMIVAALDRLGVDNGEALYVGDMVVDIETARSAGVAVCVVATGSDSASRLAAATPDRLLDRLTDLLDCIDWRGGEAVEQ